MPAWIEAVLDKVAAWPFGPGRLRLAQWRRWLDRIAAWEKQVQRLSEAELRKASLALRYRARGDEPLRHLLPEAFALVREAARRSLGMRPYDVQVLGGIALSYRTIVEMQTGEGKTLTATLPLYLYSLRGRGCHLATVNDYLARRDAEWMRPIYHLLGISVGVIQTGMTSQERREAYACDITYGTAREFGFDFLRDRLQGRFWTGQGRTTPPRSRESRFGMDGSDGWEPVQRSPFFALVDEADSVLIDEARTPLILAAPTRENRDAELACFRWSAQVAGHFQPEIDFHEDPQTRWVHLTEAGRCKLRRLDKPSALGPVSLPKIYTFVERAIYVHRHFQRDRHFVVQDEEILLVDEFTGRLAEGRRWQEGIHQAVEAQEGLPVRQGTGQAARITIQDFFLRYPHLGGMTGTAQGAAWEFRRIYRCGVVVIPTHRPMIRQFLPAQVFESSVAKWAAVIKEVQTVQALGRPVLIGTRSIDKSEHLSRLLEAQGIPHQVLHALHEEEEAEIIAQAGQRGRVTVATNMAGRGTDIRLGPGVAELGGLHVIATEMHEARRIDRQLAGRAGRQGDPGSFRQFVSWDDELLELAFGPEKAQELAQKGQCAGRTNRAFSLFRKAQRRIERRHYRTRKILLWQERRRAQVQRRLGLDPYLDMPE